MRIPRWLMILVLVSAMPLTLRADDLTDLARAYIAAHTGAGRHAAIPSFSRQTGLACSACHSTFPQLTPFGRLFKLNGYTLTGLQVVQAGDSGQRTQLKIAAIPPLSAMIQTSVTQVSKAEPGTQNGTVEFPQQLSLFLGSEITPRMGTFLQLTYDDQSAAIGLDNVDIRYANHGSIGSRDLIYGFTLNNNPTVQDVWNTAPAWSYPYASSAVAPAPAAATLIDGGLGQQVAGLGAYSLVGNTLYGEFSVYRSAPQGGAHPADGSSAGTIKSVSPYWRAAVEHQFGMNYLEVGTYGLQTRLYPAGVTGVTDRLTDLALDAQFERPLGGGNFTAHAIYIHEKQDLAATFLSGGSANKTNTLKTFRIDGSAYTATRLGATVAYFSTTGTADAGVYAPGPVFGSANGSPNSSGVITELDAMPWLNTRFAIQYVIYNKFNGASNNYDGAGRNASDNNTLYLLSWLVF